MIRMGAGTTLLRRLNLAAVAVVLALCVAAIMNLTIEVRDRLTLLAESNVDSVQWALSQLEVEMVRLQLQLDLPEPDLERFRERFDILYSRVAIIHESPLFKDLRSTPEFAAALTAVDDFLARATPVVDGSDDGLRSALPDLAADLPGLHASARTLSLLGLAFFARQSDLQREGVATTLRVLALVVSALVTALLVLLAALMRLYARSRRQAEEIRMTSARLETIVATSADAIIVANRAGRVLELNRAAEAMFGFGRDELSDTSITDLVLPPETRGVDVDRIKAQLDPARSGGRAGGRLEAEVMRRDQTRFLAEISVAAAESSDGEIVIAFVRDISDRRQAERDVMDALDRARAGERARAEFLTVMSHEMRTPLNGLLGSTEILAGTSLDAAQRNLVDVIATSGHVLLHHVNGVLDLSRAEAGTAANPESVFDIETLVAEVIANQRGLAAAAGTQLAMVTIGTPAGPVLGNPGQLRQILLNLVGNAVKFTRDGSVTVEIEPLAPVGAIRPVEFRVIDSGIGIAEADLDRVFEDFVRLDTSYGRETEGTGLGLGIVRRLVQALGGEIDAVSRPGAGSRFRVRLPFAMAPAAPAETPVVADQPVSSVLIVDDNAINRFVLRHLMEEIGLAVTEAGDGAEGVALAEDTAFDLILMDISMPKMDGIEAAHRIRRGRGPSQAARIVAVTAHAQPGERQRFRAAGMEDCLVKPVTRSMLMTLLSGREAAEATTAQAPPIATEMVRSECIADLVGHLGAEAATALIRRFLAEGDATIARLTQGLPDPAARALCHAFAGSAATFGATALSARLASAEIALAEGRPMPGGIDDLAAIWVYSRARIAALAQGIVRAAE